MLGLVAVVLFMVAVMSVLGRTTAVDLDRQRGGLDVIGTSVGPGDPDRLRRVEGVRELVALEHTPIGERSFAAEDAGDTHSELRWPVRLIRGGHELAAAQSFGLAAALDTYLLGGVIISPARYDRIVVNRGATLVLGNAAPGTSPQAIADLWGSRSAPTMLNGTNAETSRSAVASDGVDAVYTDQGRGRERVTP